MKTLETRKAIKEELSKHCEHIYYGQADDNAAFPYAVFSIEEISKNDLVPMYELEINVVGYGKDTSYVENICDNIESGMDHMTVNADHIAFTLYFDRKNNVTAEDRNIIRRLMTFSFNLYERG